MQDKRKNKTIHDVQIKEELEMLILQIPLTFMGSYLSFCQGG